MESLGDALKTSNPTLFNKTNNIVFPNADITQLKVFLDLF
jgi:hypothetical protein